MTRRHLAALPAAPFARHRGRRCRHGSLTGWAGLADLVPAPRLARVHRPLLAPVPLAPWPMAADPFFTTNPLEYTR